MNFMDGLSGAEIWITRNGFELSRSGCYKLYVFRYGLKGLVFFPTDNNGGRYCDPDNQQSFFSTFSDALREITQYTVDGDNLIFRSRGGEQVMALTRIRSSDIEYNTWRITSFFDGKSLVSVSDDLHSWITLLQGRVAGSTGCGGLLGGYELSGNTVFIKAGLWAGSCPSENISKSDLIFAALRQELKIKKEGRKILLIDKKNILRLTLEH